jgi:hypothetical protein
VFALARPATDHDPDAAPAPPDGPLPTGDRSGDPLAVDDHGGVVLNPAVHG